MRVVTGQEIRRALTFEALIEAFEAGHAGARIPVEDSVIGDETAKYFVRSTGAPGRAFGSKLITVVPGNEERAGRPSVQAVFVLFDGADGSPRALLDGTEMTYWKTAADSGLASKLLARADARSLLMVGAGRLAPWLVRAHLTVRPSIERIQIWNRTRAAAIALRDLLGDDGHDAEVADDLAAAVGAADLISTATMAREPIVMGAWLAPGTHLDLVGGWRPDMREADDEAAARSRIFVDSRASAFAGVGDILAPIANGTINAVDVRADLYDLVAGAEGRRDPEDITLFKNAGGAHLDLMTAEAILSALDTGRAP